MVRGGSLSLNAANGHGRNDALQQAAHGAGQADIDLGDAQFGVAVGAVVGEVDVIYAHDFAAVGVDDLLVEQVLAHGQPGFIGLVELERGFVGGEVHARRARRWRSDRSGRRAGGIARGSGAGRETRFGCSSGHDEHLLHAADKVAGRIVGLGAEDFGCVKHSELLFSARCVAASEHSAVRPRFACEAISAGIGQKKSPRPTIQPATGRQKCLAI